MNTSNRTEAGTSRKEGSEQAPHVVLVHRYFWPDSPPYARMLSSIAQRLAADGFRVTVLTAQPSYGGTDAHKAAPACETSNGVTIRRLRLLPERKSQLARRVMNLVVFAAKTSAHILRADAPTVVMAATTPPLLVAMMTSLAARARGAAFVYHNQDIYPEVLGTSQQASRRLFRSLAQRADTRTGRRAERVVVLSSDMASTWERRGIANAKLATINNFFDPEPQTDPASMNVTPVPTGRRRLVFAGNVGLFQDLEALIVAVGRVDDDRLELIVVGDGAALEQCEQVASHHTHFVGRTGAPEAQAWIESADACIASLHPGLIEYVYPSKTFSYLASGKPLFLRVEPESELGELVADNELGWVVPPTDATALDQALRSFAGASDPTLQTMSRCAAEVAERRNRDSALDDWVRLFRALTSEQPR